MEEKEQGDMIGGVIDVVVSMGIRDRRRSASVYLSIFMERAALWGKQGEIMERSRRESKAEFKSMHCE